METSVKPFIKFHVCGAIGASRAERGKACPLICKRDHFTPTREMRRHIRALVAREHSKRWKRQGNVSPTTTNNLAKKKRKATTLRGPKTPVLSVLFGWEAGNSRYRGTSLNKKTPPPLGPPFGPRQILLKGPRGGVVSGERGTPVVADLYQLPVDSATQLLADDTTRTSYFRKVLYLRALVLSAWCLVLGAWCLVLGAWCRVLMLGAWCLLSNSTSPTTRSLAMDLVTWHAIVARK